VLYEFLEFEFYLIKDDCHVDPFTHDGEDQRLSGAWLVGTDPSLPFVCPLNQTYLGTFTVFPAMARAPRLPVPLLTAAALGKDST
jgi:hypothetical protein